MRKILEARDYVKIATEWDNKTIEQLSEEVGVSTINPAIKYSTRPHKQFSDA